MEKKKLVINAAVCDMRGATAEKLDPYEMVTVNAATIVTSPASQALLSGHHVQLNAAKIVELPDGEDVRISEQNGSFTIGASSVAPKEKVLLDVNGTLTIEPGAEQALTGYLSIMVNGTVCCPESLAAALSGILSVNGSMTVYPDGAVLLKRTFVMDDTFPLRAKNALYFAERRVVMLDPAIDPKALLDRGVRFKTREALIAKGLAAAAIPLFDDTVNLRILPDGCAFVNDDVTLGESLLRRYGTKLYINGDLTIEKNGEPLLARIEYLVVNGDVKLPAALEQAFYAIDAEYDSVRVLRGRQLCDKPMLRIDRALVERNPEGLQVRDCAIVRLAEDIPPELIEERLTFADCGMIRCTDEQEGAVATVAEDVGMIGKDAEIAVPGVGSVGDMMKGMLGIGDTKCINAASYRF